MVIAGVACCCFMKEMEMKMDINMMSSDSGTDHYDVVLMMLLVNDDDKQRRL